MYLYSLTLVFTWGLILINVCTMFLRDPYKSRPSVLLCFCRFVLLNAVLAEVYFSEDCCSEHPHLRYMLVACMCVILLVRNFAEELRTSQPVRINARIQPTAAQRLFCRAALTEACRVTLDEGWSLPASRSDVMQDRTTATVPRESRFLTHLSEGLITPAACSHKACRGGLCCWGHGLICSSIINIHTGWSGCFDGLYVEVHG